MLTFRQYLEESAMQRKFQTYHADQHIHHPHAPLVHHEPGLSVYHMKNHKAVMDCTSGMGLCTHDPDTSIMYRSSGNLFLVKNGNKREQMFIKHALEDEDPAPNFERSGTGSVSSAKVHDLYRKLKKIPYHFEHDHEME